MSLDPLLYNLARVPRERFTHHLADYVELLCLAHIDGEFSPEDLVERWKGQDDLGAEPPEVDPDEEEPIGAPVIEPGARKPVIDDRRHSVALDVFSHLGYRAAAFKDDYPFELKSGYLKMLRRRTHLTDRHKLYVFLLLGSLLRYVPRRRHSSITTPFERLVAEVLSVWLPDAAEVHLFGTAAKTSDRYVGTMWEKINLLGADIGEQVLLTETDFHASDTGDLGLDVVAWLPVGDRYAAMPVMFAQATCELRWKDKQHESGRNWQSYLKQSAPRGNLLFIPYCFRDPSGGWFDNKWPTDAVIVDRQRLLWLLRDLDRPLAEVPYDLVAEALDYREAV